MTLLSPALDAALAADAVTMFGALTLDLPSGGPLRLLDGAGEVTIGGNLYAGESATWGVWSGFEAFEDGAGDEAPGFTLGIFPADDTAAAALSGAAMQGMEVSVSIGALNRATGAIIGDAFALFSGEVDVTRDNFGKDTSEVELECVGGMERMFFNDEGIRLAPAFHQQVWPGEDGLNHVTGVTDLIYWGARAPTSGGSGVPWQG